MIESMEVMDVRVRRPGGIVNVDYDPLMPTLSTAEAAHRMGVKVETLYAYVSRGLLESLPGPDGKSSRFDVRAIEALARRGRPRQSSRAASLNILIETQLTSLSPQGVRYRGLSSGELAFTHPFEDVAELLWGGELPRRRAACAGWDAYPLPPLAPDFPTAAIGDILQLATARLTVASPHNGRSPAEVAATGRMLIATMIESLPILGDGRTPRLALGKGPSGAPPLRGTVAGRLWTRLSPRRPAPGVLPVVNAALVLMADHELAASTLAVRVAASTHADPLATVAAGLGALSGPLHGSASSAARALLARAGEVGAARAVGEVLARRERVPGFGHRVYADVDPRAAVLLEMLHHAVPRSRALAVATDVQSVVHDRIGKDPNVDFALATLATATGMIADGGEAIMSIARVAGWLAHALEEYGEAPLRFRPRAHYVGR
jgi:citrate synthase